MQVIGRSSRCGQGDSTSGIPEPDEHRPLHRSESKNTPTLPPRVDVTSVSTGSTPSGAGNGMRSAARASNGSGARAGSTGSSGGFGSEAELRNLEDVLDYMHDRNLSFMKLYKVGSQLQRRAGGQGLVQFIERKHDGELFCVKVLAFSSALL